MNITFAVNFLDGTKNENIRLLPVDIMAWENHPKPNSHKISDLSNGASLTDMLYLAFSAIKRMGATAEPFDKWAETVESIEAVDVDDPKLPQ